MKKTILFATLTLILMVLISANVFASTLDNFGVENIGERYEDSKIAIDMTKDYRHMYVWSIVEGIVVSEIVIDGKSINCNYQGLCIDLGLYGVGLHNVKVSLAIKENREITYEKEFGFVSPMGNDLMDLSYKEREQLDEVLRKFEKKYPILREKLTGFHLGEVNDVFTYTVLDGKNYVTVYVDLENFPNTEEIENLLKKAIIEVVFPNMQEELKEKIIKIM